MLIVIGVTSFSHVYTTNTIFFINQSQQVISTIMKNAVLLDLFASRKLLDTLEY